MKQMSFEDAVESTVDECIKQGILAEFLRKHRAEVKEVSWYEYNEEQHIKNEREIAKEEGMDTLGKLIEKLIANGKSDDVTKVINDKELRKQLLEEYKI